MRIPKIPKVRGPWISYNPVPGRWIEIKKKDVTGLITRRKIRFCPHCGGKVSISRRFGIAVADRSRGFSQGMGSCKECGQIIEVIPRFMRVPYL